MKNKKPHTMTGRCQVRVRTNVIGEVTMKTLSGLFLLFVLLLNQIFAYAQANNATITGVVTDPARAVVAGAQVSATNAQTKEARRTVTDSNGRSGSVRLSGEGLLLQSPNKRSLYAFWNEPDSRLELANRLMFSAFDKATRKWKAPVTLNDDHAATTHSFQGAGIGPDGVIHVAWIDRRHNPLTGSEGYPGGGDRSRGIEPSAALYYTRSIDGGRTFAKNRYITGLVCACCQIAIGFSKGNVVLAWRSVEPGDIRDIFTTASADNGATWAEPQSASRDNWVIDACPHAAPTLTSTPTALYLAWMTAVSGKPEIYMVVSKDGGKTFGERLHVSAGMSGAMHPRLVVIGYRVGIAFEAQIAGRKEFGSTIVYRELDRLGLSAPTAIPDNPGSASAPEMAADHRGLLIGWSQPSGGSPTIHLRRRN